ncbi:MAG TPA: metal-dependent hydrolase [Candidatus Nitrosotalea sp.]|nr:metal-dependent hydrolase [Candidatus Nitrosotalea sp.]
MKKDAVYVIKTALVFCALSAAFSFVGVLLPEKGPLANPSGGLNLHEILGHILWGLVAGAVFLSARYAIATGLFAVLIDSDHLIALLHVNALARMSHSLAFSAIAVVILMISFGRKDYRLGAAAFAGVLSHLSFDTFAGDDGKFPLFVPFYNHDIIFPNIDWIYFEIAAVAVAGIVTLILSRQKKIEASV